jgi:hypothetical protein
MSNPDLPTVYSPAGEPFETSKANARDLVTHAGWSYTAPEKTTKATLAATTAPVTPPAAPAAPVTPPPVEETTEETTEETSEETSEETAAPKLRLTVEDFADLTDRADIRAYIESTFKVDADGRSSRDKLIAQAIALATAA